MDFQSLSIIFSHFQSFSVTFNHFQSLSIIFSRFQSRKNLFTPEGHCGGKQRLKPPSIPRSMVTFSPEFLAGFWKTSFRRNRTGNRNRQPEPQELFFPGAEGGTRTAGTICQDPKLEPERSFSVNCTETEKTPFFQSKRQNPKPARIVPPADHNRTEPKRGHPDFETPPHSRKDFFF